jgi:hypothetical protein
LENVWPNARGNRTGRNSFSRNRVDRTVDENCVDQKSRGLGKAWTELSEAGNVGVSTRGKLKPLPVVTVFSAIPPVPDESNLRAVAIPFFFVRGSGGRGANSRHDRSYGVPARQHAATAA